MLVNLELKTTNEIVIRISFNLILLSNLMSCYGPVSDFTFAKLRAALPLLFHFQSLPHSLPLSLWRQLLHL